MVEESWSEERVELKKLEVGEGVGKEMRRPLKCWRLEIMVVECGDGWSGMKGFRSLTTENE